MKSLGIFDLHAAGGSKRTLCMMDPDCQRHYRSQILEHITAFSTERISGRGDKLHVSEACIGGSNKGLLEYQIPHDEESAKRTCPMKQHPSCASFFARFLQLLVAFADVDLGKG